jgi:hypothetical protein
VYLIENTAPKQDEFALMVTTIESSAANVLLVDCAVETSELDTAFGVPPSAVEFTLNVAVAIPDVHFEFVSVIVPPCGALSMIT